MAAAASLNIEKSPFLGRSFSNFNEIWQSDAVQPRDHLVRYKFGI